MGEKIDEDVFIVGDETTHHCDQDGNRVTEGVNDTTVAKKAKPSTLSTDQQSFVSLVKSPHAKIDKDRKIVM